MGEPGESTVLPPMGKVAVSVWCVIFGLLGLVSLAMVAKAQDGAIFWSFGLILLVSVLGAFHMIGRYPFKSAADH